MPQISGGVNLPILLGVVAAVVALGVVCIILGYLYYRRSIGKGFFSADKSKTGGGAAKIKKAAAQAPNLADIGIGVGLTPGDGYDDFGGNLEPEMPPNMRFSNGIVYADQLTESNYDHERMSDPGVSAIEPAPIGRTDTVRQGLSERDSAHPPSVGAGGSKLDRERAMDAYYAQHAQNRLSMQGSAASGSGPGGSAGPAAAGKIERERAMEAYYAQRRAPEGASSGSGAALEVPPSGQGLGKLEAERQREVFYAEQRRQQQRSPAGPIDLGTEVVGDVTAPAYDGPPAPAPGVGKLEAERQRDAFYAEQRRQQQQQISGPIDLGTAVAEPPVPSYDAPPATPAPGVGKLEAERQRDAFYADQRRQQQQQQLQQRGPIDLGTVPSYDSQPAPTPVPTSNKLEAERQRDAFFAEQRRHQQQQQLSGPIDLGTEVDMPPAPTYDAPASQQKIDLERIRDQQRRQQEVASAAPQPVATTEDFVCVRAYNAQMPDEMELAVGDRIIIKQSFPDGWGTGYNKMTNMEGVFPLSAVIAASIVGK